jgi:hypothetical protein
VPVTDSEYTLLRSAGMAEAEVSALFGSAVYSECFVILEGTADEFDVLVGHVSFEANHPRSAARGQRFDELADRLEAAIAMGPPTDGPPEQEPPKLRVVRPDNLGNETRRQV